MAFVSSVLPSGGQQRIASLLQLSVLRPFIATQRGLAASRLRAEEVEVIQVQVDSLVARVSTLSALADENRRLRGLLELSDRVGPDFRAASALRPGTQGSQSMFLLDLGAAHGVRAGSPVVDRHGLVGVVREVRERTAVGMDWTHPDFGASAMLADGTGYGIVENRRGAFREADRLLLKGGAFHELVPEGTVVLTSGLGGVFPRGIPLGEVTAVAEEQAQWGKSYWLRPFVEPGSVTHVLVAVGDTLSPEVFWSREPGAAAPEGRIR